MFSEPGALKMGELLSDGVKLAMFRSYVCKTLERAREMEQLSQQKSMALPHGCCCIAQRRAIKWYYATANVISAVDPRSGPRAG